MPNEQRVLSTGKIGAHNPSAGLGPVKAASAEPDRPRRSRKRLFLVVGALLVLLLGGAAYYVLLGPGAAGKVSGGVVAKPAPKPGAVLTVAPVSINLSDGHYLRLGLALQLTTDVVKPPDPAKALDAAIALFSGHTVAEISDPTTRAAMKTQLATELSKVYDGEVMDVYLTNFVTQ